MSSPIGNASAKGRSRQVHRFRVIKDWNIGFKYDTILAGVVKVEQAAMN
ncbi:MAG: hypothetical protein GF398_04150 [Chitinivibrionales bacterium]|nr:hypothetical protein [Chitinivibrionales bacterium]